MWVTLPCLPPLWFAILLCPRPESSAILGIWYVNLRLSAEQLSLTHVFDTICPPLGRSSFGPFSNNSCLHWHCLCAPKESHPFVVNPDKNRYCWGSGIHGSYYSGFKKWHTRVWCDRPHRQIHPSIWAVGHWCLCLDDFHLYWWL